MADLKTNLKYILDDAGDAAHVDDDGSHPLYTERSPRHVEFASSSSSRLTPRSSLVIRGGNKSSTSPPRSTTSSRPPPGYYRPADTATDGNSVYDSGPAMNQSSYGSAPSYPPMDGYGGADYGTYSDRAPVLLSHSPRLADLQHGHHPMPLGSAMPYHGVAGSGIVGVPYRESSAYGPGPMVSDAPYSMSMAGDMDHLTHYTDSLPGTPPGEVRLTPVTRRVSRAKKGVPVHTCEVCTPPKVFTRAEHLRRHQLSHQTPHFKCNFPDCRRSFHRADLLNRHKQRHRSGEESQPGSDMEPAPLARRGSSQSVGSSSGGLHPTSSASSAANGPSSSRYHGAYMSERGGEYGGAGAVEQRHAAGERAAAAAAGEQQYHQQYQQQFSYSSSTGAGFGHGDQVNSMAVGATEEHEAGGPGVHVRGCVAGEAVGVDGGYGSLVDLVDDGDGRDEGKLAAGTFADWGAAAYLAASPASSTSPASQTYYLSSSLEYPLRSVTSTGDGRYRHPLPGHAKYSAQSSLHEGSRRHQHTQSDPTPASGWLSWDDPGPLRAYLAMPTSAPTPDPVPPTWRTDGPVCDDFGLLDMAVPDSVDGRFPAPFCSLPPQHATPSLSSSTETPPLPEEMHEYFPACPDFPDSPSAYRPSREIQTRQRWHRQRQGPRKRKQAALLQYRGSRHKLQENSVQEEDEDGVGGCFASI